MDIGNIVLDEGVGNISLFQEDGNFYVSKQFGKNYLKFFKKIEKTLFKKLLTFSNNSHLEMGVDSKDFMKREYNTWKLWKEEGLESLDLKEFSKDKLVWKYVEGSESLNQNLNKGFSEEVFGNFVDLYQTIRELAKKKKDSSYFHSDPHLGNFLLKQDKKIIPIDSGSVLNKKLGLEELDSHLLKRVLYGVANLDAPEEDKRGYVEIFSSILEEKDKDFLLNYDYEVKAASKIYFNLREELASRIKGRDKQNPFEVLDKFVIAYDSYIKEILENC